MTVATASTQNSAVATMRDSSENEVLSAQTWALIDALVAVIFVGVVAGISLGWLA